MLYTVNLYSDLCQLFFNKTGGKRFKKKLGTMHIGLMYRKIFQKSDLNNHSFLIIGDNAAYTK